MLRNSHGVGFPFACCGFPVVYVPLSGSPQLVVWIGGLDWWFGDLNPGFLLRVNGKPPLTPNHQLREAESACSIVFGQCRSLLSFGSLWVSSFRRCAQDAMWTFNHSETDEDLRQVMVSLCAAFFCRKR